MPQTYKKLAELNPSAATLTTLYTVPASTSTIVSTLQVCNRGAATTFRVSHAVAGAADNNVQYLYFDTPIPANESFSLTLGITLAATDVLRALATLATITFTVYGVENT